MKHGRMTTTTPRFLSPPEKTMPEPLPDPDWLALRRKMAVTERWAYFDHAAVAPLPTPAREAVTDWAADFATCGDVNWTAWARRLETLRRRAAERFGAEPKEIALIHSTTEGISLVAEGFPWQAGDNVVLFEGEFPSNLYPWMNLRSRGVEIRWVPTRHERFDLQDAARLCDARTKMVAVSWVGYATGWRNDLEALADIADRSGALLFVDAIQGLGVLPLDVGQVPIDFFAADGHKWMLGAEGAGLLYIRHEHLEQLRPLGIGWNSVKHATDYARVELDLKTSASRYEGGTPNMVGFAALGASFEMLCRYPIEAIAARIIDLGQQACQRLKRLGATIASDRAPDRRSGIITFTLPDTDPVALRQVCLERGVVLSCRAGRLRISPHAYNNLDDIERLISALESSLKQQR